MKVSFLRAAACFSALVLIVSALADRATAGAWRLDQVAGRRALARGELGLAGELLATALHGAGRSEARAAVLEDLFATGALLAGAGEIGPAIEALRLSLAGRRELYGAESPELEPHLTLLGTLEMRTRGRRARDDRRQAAVHLGVARQILERSVGTDHPTARQAVELLLQALRLAGRRDEARALAGAMQTRQGRPREARASKEDDVAQLRRLEEMRQDLIRRKKDEAAAIRAAPSGSPEMLLPAPEAPPSVAPVSPVAAVARASAAARPPRVPRLPSIRDREAEDPLQARLERYRRLLQAHEGWVRHPSTRAAPVAARESQALSGLAELEELSYQADRLRLEATLGERPDVTEGVDGLEARIEGLLPDYGALAGGLGGAL